MKGPIPFSDFMEQALANPRSGYYSSQPIGTSVIGPHGDFITSPELCSVFGELVAAFYINAWINMGKPRRVILCEIGCGTGALMSDFLRGVATISPEMWTCLEVHVVEISPAFRASCAEKLHWTSKSVDKASSDPSQWMQSQISGSCPAVGRRANILPHLPVTFHSELSTVPEHAPIFVVAHELFDALPVMKFKLCRDAETVSATIYFSSVLMLTPLNIG